MFTLELVFLGRISIAGWTFAPYSKLVAFVVSFPALALKLNPNGYLIAVFAVELQ